MKILPWWWHITTSPTKGMRVFWHAFDVTGTLFDWTNTISNRLSRQNKSILLENFQKKCVCFQQRSSVCQVYQTMIQRKIKPFLLFCVLWVARGAHGTNNIHRKCMLWSMHFLALDLALLRKFLTCWWHVRICLSCWSFNSHDINDHFQLRYLA